LHQRGHQVDAFFTGWHDEYYKNADWSTEEGKSLVKIYKSLQELQEVNIDQYDIVIGNGLFGMTHAFSTNADNMAWFCQNFDPYIFGWREDVQYAYSRCQKYLTYSHDLAKIISHYYGDKKFVICNNGVEYKKFLPFQRKEPSSNRRVCFMVAYYRDYKGVCFAEKVFAELYKRGFTTVEINVVGGPLPSTMEYHNNPSFEDKCKIIAGCDVMLHPSVFETWNLVSMESMAIGTPVVGVDSKGIMEYATDENSMIFKDRNPSLLCDAIEELVSNKSMYKDIQGNGIETAAAHDWDLIMPQIEQSYMELI
jgi:glycosyltransferase involved in cell wall biosynthesis